LVLGEMPNLAARLQGLAEPATVVINAATYRLVQGVFTCRELGSHRLEGISKAVPIYRVLDRWGTLVRRGIDEDGSGIGPLREREDCYTLVGPLPFLAIPATLDDSLKVARRQRAKALELRAATNLSRLWQRQGKRDEARQLLSGI
jgi:hypothetical protein